MDLACRHVKQEKYLLDNAEQYVIQCLIGIRPLNTPLIATDFPRMALQVKEITSF